MSSKGRVESVLSRRPLSGKFLSGRFASTDALVAALALVMVVGAVATYQISRSSDEDMRSDLLIQAKVGAYAVDLQQLEDLTGTLADENSTDLKSLYEQQRSIARANPSCRWTYLTVLRGGNVTFLVDSEPPESEDGVYPGMVYDEAPPAFRDAFGLGQEATIGPYSDRWGTWISTIVPLRDPNTGAVVAVFGMDVDASSWKERVAESCIPPVMVTLLFSALLVVFFSLYRRSDVSGRSIAAYGEKLQEALMMVKKSEANFSTFFNSSPDFILVLGTDGSIIKANDTVIQRLGYPEPELIGQPAQMVYSSDLQDRAEGIVEKMLEDRTCQHLGYFQARSGQKILVETKSVSGEWDQRPALFCMSKDISHLKLSEEKFSKAFNSSSVLIAIVSSNEGEFLDANPAFLSALGFSRQEVMGKTFWDLGIFSLQSDFSIKWDIFSGRTNDVEVKARAKDGSIRYGLLSADQITVEGEPCWLVGMTDDTERRLAEESLRREEARTKALFDLSQMSGMSAKEIADRAMEHGVALTRSQLGYIAFVNQDESVLTMQHWSKQGLAECRIQEKPLVYPVKSTGLWGEAVRQRRPVITNDYSAPNPWKRGYPEGHVNVVRHMNVPVFDRDRIVAVAGVANKDADYTDKDAEELALLMDGMWRIVRKIQAEEEICESERRLSDIIDFLPDATFAIDGHGRIVTWNRAMEEMTGSLKAEMLGKGDRAYALPFYGNPRPLVIDFLLGDCPDVEDRYDYIIRRGDQMIAETFVPGLFNGRGAYLWIIAAPLYDGEGSVTGAIESIRDITERKQAEDRLKATLKEREVLLKEVHHRVKNNLQIISSLIRLQSDRMDDPRTASALMESRSRVLSMAMVHEKLYQSQSLAMVNFADYIRDLAHGLVSLFGNNDLKLNLNLDDVYLEVDKAIPCGLIANELITNSLKHAFKASQRGQIDVSLHMAEGQIRLSVKDNGCGLPEGLDPHTSGSLGLSLINALTGQLKGTLEVKSEGGAEFLLSFWP